MRGLAHRRPVIAAVITLMLFSLAGIPLTGGFVGKLYVLAAGAWAGLRGLTTLVIVGSGIDLFYYLRVVAVMFAAGAAERSMASSRSIIALPLLLALVIAWLGILPDAAMQAACAAR